MPRMPRSRNRQGWASQLRHRVPRVGVQEQCLGNIARSLVDLNLGPIISSSPETTRSEDMRT